MSNKQDPTKDAAFQQLIARMTGQEYDASAILAKWPDCPVNDFEALPAWMSAQFGIKDPDKPFDVLGWNVHTLAQAYKPRPPVKHIIEDIYRLPSLNCVYASPGKLKTMFVLDQSICVAGGLPWLPPLKQCTDTERVTLQSAVLWVDCDNGPRAMHTRLEAMGRARGLPEDAPLYYVSMPTPWMDASNFASVRTLAKRVKALSAKLVVLDNLRNVSGSVDENSADMGTVMANLRRLAEDTKAAVVVIHHQRKSSGGGNQRAGDSLRGHSSIEAALDLALLIERKGQSDSIVVKATKTRDADILPFGAYFTYEHRPGTSELAKARFFGVEVDGVITSSTIRSAILQAVEQQPGMNQAELIKNVKASLIPANGKSGPGVNRIRDEILNLSNKGKLDAKRGNKNATLYYSNLWAQV